jgi:hypothetical protein
VDDQDYLVPFKLTGKIDKPKFALDEPRLTPEDIKKLKESAAKANDQR